MEIKINQKTIGIGHPTYFIADIAANHDGNLDRAKKLIQLAKDCGADAAKFQNFSARKIVSDYGFRNLGGRQSHQEKWDKSVFEVYQDASIPLDWTPILKEECDRAGIDYFSSPYDFDAIDYLYSFMPAYKIGSGEIDWLEALARMADKGKPVLLATGAAAIGEVQRAVHTILDRNKQLVLMQCNTNYTASEDNFHHIHLRVLDTYRTMFPDVILGLSDHTFGHATVLGAVALGARVIEKHFTDDNDRPGPDHKFAMNPNTWLEMVKNTRLLEQALGGADKTIAANERETSVIQRRCVRAGRDLKKGEIITRQILDVLRPATPGAILPDQINSVIGMKTAQPIPFGKEICWGDLISGEDE